MGTWPADRDYGFDGVDSVVVEDEKVVWDYDDHEGFLVDVKVGASIYQHEILHHQSFHLPR